MRVGFNTISFKAENLNPAEVEQKPVAEAPKVEEKPAGDEFVSKEPVVEPKKRKTFAERFANVWKFFASADELVKGYSKGIFWGLGAGAATAGTFWLFKGLPKVFLKEGPSLKAVVKHPLKYIGTAGKVVTGLVAASVFAYNAISAHFQKNQRTAVIDHKLKVGHRDA